MFATPGFAISIFHVHWKDHYLTGNNNGIFVNTARKAGCYVCHIKGERKEDVRNEYGAALAACLSADDFPKDWAKANPEEAKKRIIAALEKVEEELSADKKKFGDKIKNGSLPAVDSGL